MYFFQVEATSKVTNGPRVEITNSITFFFLFFYISITSLHSYQGAHPLEPQNIALNLNLVVVMCHTIVKSIVALAVAVRKFGPG